MATKKYAIGGNLVIVDDAARSLRTFFPDGSSLFAIPQEDEAYRACAADLGYETTWGLCREHEIIHSWLAVLTGYTHSPTLWTVAHRDHPDAAPDHAREAEEWLVIEFQRMLNSGTIPDGPPLSWLAARGHDLATLRAEVLRRFRP